MAERIKHKRSMDQYMFVLDNGEVAERENLACIDTATGNVKPGKDGVTTLIPIGTFLDNLTGDGVTKVNVEFFDEFFAHFWDNDSASALDSTDIGSECYILDAATVSADGTGRSKAGLVLGVDVDDGVLVYGGIRHTGATGAAAAGAHVADMTALKAIAAANRSNGKLVMVDADGSSWRFAASSTAADTSEQLVASPAAGTGKWLRADKQFTMSLAILFSTADAAVLHTVPAGFVLKLAANPYWDVTTPFTGGTNSSIGLSSSKAGYSTKGDLIAGALAAALTPAGVHPGTIGNAVDSFAELAALFLEAGDTLRHDRIASVYTAGAGNVRVPVIVCTAPPSA
jgi:hypothetical protein